MMDCYPRQRDLLAYASLDELKIAVLTHLNAWR
jgi:hypothetical protein